MTIYDYFSYHEYLEAWFDFQKKNQKRFSQREFLRRANISGSAVLHRVLQGARIPSKYILNFIKALELNASEMDYFYLLIDYEDAKSVKDRGEAFSGLLKKRAAFPKYQIDDQAIKFFKRWYYPVVREIISLLDGEEDYNKISRMVIPPITSIQAKNAVKFLEKNNFLTRSDDNRLELSEPFFSTGAPRVSGLLAAYHLKNLEINGEAVDQVDKGLLSMSSLTLKTSPETYSQMRKELADFRNRLISLARADEDPSQVFHLNFTFLPRSRGLKDKES